LSQQKVAYVLASGGIDSTACIAYYLDLGFDVRLIFINFGHPANAEEMRHIRQISSHYGLSLQEIELRGADVDRVGEIKGRNAAFVTIALMAHRNLSGVLALGIHAGSP
jgi:7-cyano-7-deazaguanine synthase